jgi:hypothetical protein
VTVEQRTGVKRTLTPVRPRDETTNDEFIAALRRLLRALSRRAGADLLTFHDMAQLDEELHGHMIDAVARLRHDPVLPASWQDIGNALGISRQAAQERFGKVGGIRRPVGQPGNWR